MISCMGYYAIINSRALHMLLNLADHIPDTCGTDEAVCCLLHTQAAAQALTSLEAHKTTPCFFMILFWASLNSGDFDCGRVLGNNRHTRTTYINNLVALFSACYF